MHVFPLTGVFVYDSSTEFGQGSGPILFDDLTCSRNEASLQECSSSSPNPEFCSHSSDVGVRCEHIASSGEHYRHDLDSLFFIINKTWMQANKIIRDGYLVTVRYIDSMALYQNGPHDLDPIGVFKNALFVAKHI